jgi:hypothetical protein
MKQIAPSEGVSWHLMRCQSVSAGDDPFEMIGPMGSWPIPQQALEGVDEGVPLAALRGEGLKYGDARKGHLFVELEPGAAGGCRRAELIGRLPSESSAARVDQSCRASAAGTLAAK